MFVRYLNDFFILKEMNVRILEKKENGNLMIQNVLATNHILIIKHVLFAKLKE